MWWNFCYWIWQNRCVLATDADQTGLYTPNTWRTETIDLSAYVGSSKVDVYIRSISGWGQQLFIDNIALTGVQTLSVASNTFNEKIKLYPNPTNENFEIAFTNIQQSLNVNIYSTLGQIVQTKVYENTDLIEMKLKQPSGIYFVEIINNKGDKYFSRLIKK